MSLHICPMSWYIGVGKRSHLLSNLVMHHEASVLHPIYYLPFFYILHPIETQNLERERDLCVSSLRRCHANLLCIVPILSDAPKGTIEICIMLSWLIIDVERYSHVECLHVGIISSNAYSGFLMALHDVSLPTLYAYDR